MEESNGITSQRNQQEWRPAGKTRPYMSTYRCAVHSPTCGYSLCFRFCIFCKTMSYRLGHKSAMLPGEVRTYRQLYLMEEYWSFIEGVALTESLGPWPLTLSPSLFFLSLWDELACISTGPTWQVKWPWTGLEPKTWIRISYFEAASGISVTMTKYLTTENTIHKLWLNRKQPSIVRVMLFSEERFIGTMQKNILI